MIDRKINYPKFIEGSRAWLKRYIQDNHLKSIVIGISGGIDSTVSCALAAPVCRELDIPLIGRPLMSITNETEELDIAELVGQAFCDDFKFSGINRIYTKIVEDIQEAEEIELTPLQKGNIKARYRAIYLRNLASIHKGAVLDNDNFTEWNLGFWTIGGDSPMDINLGLHYLWKTEVYQLAYELAREAETKDESEAIMASIKLQPTDGNGVSKTDCDQFGLKKYEEVDEVLYRRYYNPIPNVYSHLVASYGREGVDKVIALHEKTAYKRLPSPQIPTETELSISKETD